MKTPIHSQDDSQTSCLTGVVVAICNCPDADTASRLARGLVEARLAACVNQLPPVQSTYRWQGQIESADEHPLLIKTTLASYPKVQNWLADQHPYDLPEIIAVPVTAGLPAYLDWVTKEVAT
ncbi:divalent-cation tolerance protein CutA [Andreprevotia chitinilytica]|uniref:divalent-cation tolerance protein CutA n=1 Tax=Andreprevotia chitinilytica TaxID=396808 RepID=UPI00068ECA2E|nr:divalent-cation tolerance protein CutA [Andreprevotia chitinilytica]